MQLLPRRRQAVGARPLARLRRGRLHEERCLVGRALKLGLQCHHIHYDGRRLQLWRLLRQLAVLEVRDAGLHRLKRQSLGRLHLRGGGRRVDHGRLGLLGLALLAHGGPWYCGGRVSAAEADLKLGARAFERVRARNPLCSAMARA